MIVTSWQHIAQLTLTLFDDSAGLDDDPRNLRNIIRGDKDANYRQTELDLRLRNKMTSYRERPSRITNRGFERQRLNTTLLCSSWKASKLGRQAT